MQIRMILVTEFGGEPKERKAFRLMNAALPRKQKGEVLGTGFSNNSFSWQEEYFPGTGANARGVSGVVFGVLGAPTLEVSKDSWSRGHETGREKTSGHQGLS